MSFPLSASQWSKWLLNPRTRVTLLMGGRTTVSPQWAVPRRVLPRDHALYLVLRHSISGEVGGETHKVLPGMLLWIPPGVSHTLEIGERHHPFETWWFRFRIEPPDRVLRRSPRPLVEAGAWDAITTLQMLGAELHSAGGPSTDRLRALLLLLGTRPTLRAVHDSGLTPPQRRIIESLAEHSVAKRLRPADLAAAVELSEDYFTRLFHRTYGIAPRGWLMRERIRAAAMRLVDSTASVKAVARELGYVDLYLFSRQFKQVMGRSPRVYRRLSE